MVTPYDWQEGIANRAQYIEAKLAQGAPVIAISLDIGILFFTHRRQGRKLFEIYDRLIFGAFGQQSDVEALRLAALEFCSREGFNRSEEDVTLARVAVALSGPMKTAFSDFTTSPLIARVLIGELAEKAEEDRYYVLDFDGDFVQAKGSAVIAGSDALSAAISARLGEVGANLTVPEAQNVLQKIWDEVVAPEIETNVTTGLRPEALLLERNTLRANRFTLLTESD